MENDAQNQVFQIYDNLLKRLLEHHAGAIIPRLLASSGLETVNIVEELNVEVLIPPRRNDRVFRSLVKNEPHITHFEIEVSGNSRMDARLLVYHSLLFEKYNQPVISVIVYPFKTTMVKSPLQETSGGEELVTFHYRRIPLWELDARTYFDEHEVCMYALLPAMCGASQEMHVQAIDQMIQYYQGDDNELRNQLLCFGIMMRRAEMLPTVEINEVLKRMKEYDPLIAEDAYLQALVSELADKKALELVAEAETRIKAEAEARARTEIATTFKHTLLNIINVRFPSLAQYVEQGRALPDGPDALNLLIVQVSSAPDERVARAILGIPAVE